MNQQQEDKERKQRREVPEDGGASVVDQPWTREWREITEQLSVDPEQGLSEAEAQERLEKYGANRLREAERKSTWRIFIEQFKSLIMGLLAVAAVLSFAFGEIIEGGAIVVVILINAVIGFVTELRAVRSMEALQELSSIDAKVRRDGQATEIPAEEIVPGDVVILQDGDVITADLRLIEASKLQADESALTGESAPVDKTTSPMVEDEETPLAERESMAFKGTAVTRGAGEGIAVATGLATELGQISSLVAEAEEEATPLEVRLEKLGRKLIWVTLGIAAIVAISGIIAGRDLLLMVETAIALAVASVPEGLPIVATIALARGMWRMAQRNALINQLSSVETLGATNVILTDKTGTLTENRMTLTRISLAGATFEITGRGLATEGEFQRASGEENEAESKQVDTIDPHEDERLQRFLEIGVLCNDASFSITGDEDGDEDAEEVDAATIGDPLEVALLVAGAKAELTRNKLLEKLPEAREVAFDADVKMMATYHELPDAARYRVAVKGALESVLDASTQIWTEEGTQELTEEQRERWHARNQALAEEGLRIIAMAFKEVDATEGEPYENLTFLGLAALLDPPREEVRASIEACQDAGIKVVMVTGDQPATARTVALEVGLIRDEDARVVYGQDLKSGEDLTAEERDEILATPIFARVNPKQKLDLIAVHQDSGAVVAMTGDGVNDAPALKKADIGVAMGQRGTQVAREAADMILKDDAFSSIVTAVEQGRVIFNNIRKFVLYLLSCNVAEIMIVGMASVVNAPLPIRPLQILFLNLITDVFPALALGVGEGDPHIMEHSPRDPEEPILARQHWITIMGYSALITIGVLSVLAAALTYFGMARERAVTLSFLTLAFAQLWHVFNMRDTESGFLRNDITQNPYVWGALVLCTALLVIVVYVPFLADLLSLAHPGVTGWGLILVGSLMPWAVGQILHAFDVG
ncbi:MAG: cation-translocating P-type ATPase [Anaerolineales bacterium]